MSELTTIPVTTTHPYDILVGPGASGSLAPRVEGASRVAVVHPHSLAAMAASLSAGLPAPVFCPVPDGEAAKTPEVIAGLWRRLAQAGLTRNDVVVGIGGGATTDLAGFLAATWLRGVGLVTVPTTVLAMADAAVGGKTGIDLPEGKNLVGAFWEPRAVLCDLDLLAGLPAAEIAAGLAEVLKAGLIADPAILDLAQADDPLDVTTPAFRQALERAIAVKAAVVSDDVREMGGSSGVGREALNYGHTLAHAIETAEHYTWRHGDAVAVGLLYAALVAQHLGLLDADAVALHRRVLRAAGLPTTYIGAGWTELRAIMARDKKARGSTLRLVLLDGLGHPLVRPGVDEAVLEAAFADLVEAA
ncbi:MAG: 3-dehydroquinate synthase [Propionibacteriaceae bacterium]|jgi:3-dehydroquinate synthase|nr:3-dehydroquinate synthase [Propionibacteriaceae bacterium]